MLATKPLDIRPDHAKIIHKILKDNLEEGTYVFAFGSRANWTAKQSSDLDLAMDGFGVKLDKKIKSNLEDAFEESDLPYKVDVVDLNSVSESFGEAIQDQLVRVLWDWETYRFDQLFLNSSKSFKFQKDQKVVFINTGDVLCGNFLHNNMSDASLLPGQAKKAIKQGDILLSEIRPKNRRYAFVDFQADQYVVSTKFIILSIDEKLINSQFARTILTSDQNIQILQTIAESRSATFPQITYDAIGFIKFTLPPLPEQKQIAEILSSLDNKIEINKQINKTLEEMAEALFKSWFIDFDPVRVKKAALEAGADEEGANLAVMKFISSKTEKELEKFRNDYPEKYRELEDVAKLFPAEFQDGELGEIPEGWRVGKLGDICSLKSGFAFAGDDFVENSDTLVLKIKDLKGSGVVDLSDISFVKDEIKKIERVQYFKLKVGDIVLAMSGNTTGKIGAIPNLEEELFLNQRVGKFFIDDEKYQIFIYLFLMSGNYEEKILSMGYGSAQPNINPTQIENIDVIYSDNDTLENFINATTPIFTKKMDNLHQIQSLTRSRDELLPRLMRGELCG